MATKWSSESNVVSGVHRLRFYRCMRHHGNCNTAEWSLALRRLRCCIWQSRRQFLSFVSLSSLRFAGSEMIFSRWRC